MWVKFVNTYCVGTICEAILGMPLTTILFFPRPTSEDLFLKYIFSSEATIYFERNQPIRLLKTWISQLLLKIYGWTFLPIFPLITIYQPWQSHCFYIYFLCTYFFFFFTYFRIFSHIFNVFGPVFNLLLDKSIKYKYSVFPNLICFYRR